jgi:hypothetical protein
MAAKVVKQTELSTFFDRRDMAEILPKRRKTPINQSIVTI